MGSLNDRALGSHGENQGAIDIDLPMVLHAKSQLVTNIVFKHFTITLRMSNRITMHVGICTCLGHYCCVCVCVCVSNKSHKLFTSE